MGRQAKLWRKGGYWYSEAGGRAKRFGRVGEVAREDALRRFRERLASDIDRTIEPWARRSHGDGGRRTVPRLAPRQSEQTNSY